MKLNQVGQYGHQAVRLGLVSCFLVRSEDAEKELIMVDTGLPGSTIGLLHAATDLGGRITQVILTHGHGDHAGSADSLVKALGNEVALIAGKIEAPYMGLGTVDPALAKPPAFANFTRLKTQPHRLVEEGDRIGTLRVLFTPGHSPGHLALIDERDGTIYCGDAFTNVRELAVSGVLQPWFPFPALATWDKAAALHSAEKLTALRPSRLAPCHGSIQEDPAAVMEEAVLRAKTNLSTASSPTADTPSK